jgi:hypothetical protein
MVAVGARGATVLNVKRKAKSESRAKGFYHEVHEGTRRNTKKTEKRVKQTKCEELSSAL